MNFGRTNISLFRWKKERCWVSSEQWRGEICAHRGSLWHHGARRGSHETLGQCCRLAGISQWLWQRPYRQGNAYFRGAMLGYTRKFMDEIYDQIIEFAELENFQDKPFMQLSRGMKSIQCSVGPVHRSGIQNDLNPVVHCTRRMYPR